MHPDFPPEGRARASPATPEREFLELSVLGHVLELAGSEGSAVSQQRYTNTYAAFMSEHQLRAPMDDVRLVGERQGGVGVRHLGGTFRLWRVGIAPGRPLEDWQVETGRYLFRGEADSGSLVPRIDIK